jgi:geranylgeranyl diphosphate synthase type II
MSLEKYKPLIDGYDTYKYLEKYPTTLYDPIDYHLSSGGKKLRALLTLFATDMLGGNAKEAVPAAIAVEYFHNFTLMHDDIMDNSFIRRGKKSVFKEYDTNTAILSGDVLMIMAYKALEELNPKYLPDVFKILNQTAIEVCQGQRLDIDFEEKLDISIDEYIEMIRLKTSVLIGAALQIGALVGESSKEVAQQLYNYGVNLGIAFQMQDDILDCFGDTDKVGKIKGGDIIRNKKTFLLIHAIEIAKEKNDSEFLKALEKTDWSSNTEKENYFLLKFDEFETLEHVNLHKTKLIEEGIAYLNSIEIDSNNKSKLISLVDILVNREM